jgi:hypothetical protein
MPSCDGGIFYYGDFSGFPGKGKVKIAVLRGASRAQLVEQTINVEVTGLRRNPTLKLFL